MKRYFLIANLIIYWSAAFGQFDTIALNGSVTSGEYGIHNKDSNYTESNQGPTTGITNWYCSWNNDSLFATQYNLNSQTNADAINVYLDWDNNIPVNTGSGLNVGFNFDGFAPNLPINADVLLIAEDGLTRIYSVVSGSWNLSSSSALKVVTDNNSSNGTIEISVAWSDIKSGGRPTMFNWLGFLSFGSGGGGFLRPVPPTNNYCGGGCVVNLVRYYNVSNTNNGSATKPFRRDCYTHIGNDISNFGAIDVWNFTMNTAGKYISRTAGNGYNWNIANDLVVGNGTIYFNTNASQTYISGDVAIFSGGILDIDNSTGETTVSKTLSNSGTLKGSSSSSSICNLKLNFSNQGTFTSNNTKFVFNGTSIAQTISGDLDGSDFFGRLEVNNSNGIIDNSTDSLAVKDSLILTNGIIQAKNYLVLRNGAKVKPLGGSATSFVDSTLIWEVFSTDSVIFPIGKSSEWAPMGIKPQNSMANRKYQARYTKSGYNTFNIVGSGAGLLDHISHLEYWDLSELSGATGTDKACQVSLYWRAYSQVSATAADWDSLLVCHFNGSVWNAVDSPANNVNGASASFGVVKTISYTSDFSPFTIGTALATNPLPVSLISFNGTYTSERAIGLQWQTASEFNCDNFSLQKKIEEKWFEIDNKMCSAISNEIKTYIHSDYNLLDENSYRLVQQDINGETKVFGPVVVYSSNLSSQIIPNPANGSFKIANNAIGSNVYLIDAFGAKVALECKAELYTTIALRSGIYSVLVVDKFGKQTFHRLVIVN